MTHKLILISKDIKESLNKSNYLFPYYLDKLDKQGLTIEDYIDYCLLFELDNIKVIPRDCNKDVYSVVKDVKPLVALLICPDGLGELQIIGETEICNKIIEFFKITNF